jgi:hypothetical protein
MLVLGAVGGLALGVFARLWMRLISNKPEFTWNGTISIVLGFVIFGLTQSIVATARHRARPQTVTFARVVGGVGMLPLFVAAGAIMFPTVVGGGLALARVGWARTTRLVCVGVAALPVAFVGSDLLKKFGWSPHTFAGFVVMLVVYGVIVRATRLTFAAQADRMRLSRRTTITMSVVLGLLFLVPLVGGGIN